MIALKIGAKNKDKIEAALAAVNGRAEAFTISSFCDVAALARQCEDKLEKSLLPKAERVGASASIRPEGPGARAYRYNAKSTRIEIERRAVGWFLLSIKSEEVRPAQSENIKIRITQAQAAAIQQRSVRDYIVVAPADPATYVSLDLREAAALLSGPCPAHVDDDGLETGRSNA